MNLAEYYKTLSDEDQEHLDNIYIHDFIEQMDREKFNEFDKDTFIKVSEVWSKKLDTAMSLIRGIGFKMIIMCLISGMLGFLIKGWWFV